MLVLGRYLNNHDLLTSLFTNLKKNIFIEKKLERYKTSVTKTMNESSRRLAEVNRMSIGTSCKRKQTNNSYGVGLWNCKVYEKTGANLVPLKDREVSHPRVVSTPLYKPYTVGMYCLKR